MTDGFDVKDIDVAATSFPQLNLLNFIVEHVGLPRIDDFCYMATQEPNVYAGLAVVIGIREVEVKLEDHYTGQEIGAAVGCGDGFTGAFPGETVDDDLAALRELFLRKALVARQSRLCEALLAAGATPEEVTGRRVADLPEARDARRCLELRRALGLPHTEDSPAFVLPGGRPLVAGEPERWLRTARLVRMGLEVNGGICRSLLQFRHGVAVEDPEEV